MAGARGFIRGATPAQRAVALAGWLAEQGARQLVVVEEEGGWTLLAPRRTDLPGELLRRVASGPVEVLTTDRPLRVLFTSDDCVWESGEGSAPAQSADSDA